MCSVLMIFLGGFQRCVLVHLHLIDKPIELTYIEFFLSILFRLSPAYDTYSRFGC